MPCSVCGKEVSLLGQTLRKCKICGEMYCKGKHGKKGKCNICREKAGEL